ncbi:MAG: hypothetical protein HYR48_06835 [Gemmatimonadetes bacterium]|nr:hypothetical protein [Gemmatimonadota bacterium]
MTLGLALVFAWQAWAVPYQDPATALLIARARERHRQLDAAVQNYQATVHTRIDANVGRGRFARLIPLAAIEQESELSWQAPNDVRVVAIGQRTRTALAGTHVEAAWTRPWFIPRFLGDSIRLLDEDFPNRAAIHPLAAGAEGFYRYAIEDSLELALPGRTVRAVGVRVTPTRADAALIAGEIWLDGETAETVRLTFAFVGRRLWADPEGNTRRDSVRADRANAMGMRVLRVTADLEYGLFENRYWLPFRQSLTLNAELPWVQNLVVPIHFITSFRNVRVNRGAPIGFTMALPDTGSAERREPLDDGERSERRQRRREDADSVSRVRRAQGYASGGRWPGGRYEVVVPPDSTLRAYDRWTDSIRLGLEAEDVQRLEETGRELMRTLERLPVDLTGRPRFGFAVDRFADLARYNRAEGLSFGVGTSWRLGAPFLSANVRGRYAFTDRRLQGWLGLRRDAPGARSEVALVREMWDADPLAPGLTVGNSFSSLWFAHDDGAYVFIEGGEARHQRPWGRRADLTLEVRAGRESAPRRLARSAVNDFLGGSGAFQPNQPVISGTFVTASAAAAGGNPALSWRAGLEATAGDRTLGRAWLSATRRAPLPLRLDVTAYGAAGASVGDSVPQRLFRLGGARTLRGYAAGALQGASAWSLGVDVGLRRRFFSPVVFADVGQTAPHGLSFTGDPSASAGIAISALRGTARLQAARPLERGAGWRFDLIFGARR